MALILRPGVCLLRNLYYMGESRPQLGARGRLTYIRSTTLPAHAPPFAELVTASTSTQKTNIVAMLGPGAHGRGRQPLFVAKRARIIARMTLMPPHLSREGRGRVAAAAAGLALGMSCCESRVRLPNTV